MTSTSMNTNRNTCFFSLFDIFLKWKSKNFFFLIEEENFSFYAICFIAYFISC